MRCRFQEAQGEWSLTIPHIALDEFRPSLLQKEGDVSQTLDPFLIRNLQLYKLQGTVGDRSSFTGTGDFHFINSFKRSSSLLDLPAEVLGRIFGLDLEILIPVRGDVTFVIQDERVLFTSLSDAFSENQRSKIFPHQRKIAIDGL